MTRGVHHTPIFRTSLLKLDFVSIFIHLLVSGNMLTNEVMSCRLDSSSLLQEFLSFKLDGFKLAGFFSSLQSL